MSKVNPPVYSTPTNALFRVSPLNRQSLGAFTLMCIVNWMAHFYLARGFGLYEDDYSFISPAFGMDFHQLLAHISAMFARWPQGRPLGHSIPSLLSFVGYNLGGLYGLYIIAFFILSLNAFLVYILVKRSGFSESLALMAGLAFCIFPADTTRSFLGNALHLEVSLIFLLIASLCYLSGRKTLSYFIIIGSLLTYESPFMVFFGIPLLQQKWDRKFAKELFRHIVILFLIIVCVFGIRYFMNESRVHMGTGIFLVPPKILASMIIGPLASFGLFLYAPVATLLHFDINVMIAFLVCLAAISWILLKSKKNLYDIVDGNLVITNTWIDRRFEKFKIPPKYWRLAQLYLVGIVLLCLAYTLSFTHFPPIQYHGRLTSVHLAASIGSSILFACLATTVIAIADQYRFKFIGIALLAIYLSFAIGYSVFIQEDFVQSWRAQRCFWTEVLLLAPDLSDGTVIFFPYDASSEPKYIHIHSWADPIILEQIYDFPPSWKYPPRLFTVTPNWAQSTFLKDGQIMWNVPTTRWPPHSEVLSESNLILLQMVNQSL